MYLESRLKDRKEVGLKNLKGERNLGRSCGLRVDWQNVGRPIPHVPTSDVTTDVQYYLDAGVLPIPLPLQTNG
jgi:hypothetical protein